MKKTFQYLTVLTAFLFLSSFFTAPTGYQVGDKAMDFKLKNVDGKVVSLADNHAAKGYIVIFTCNTCPVSQAYEDRIIALHQKYAPQGYPVIAINPNDPTLSPGDAYAEMKKRSEEKKFNFPYLIDETQEVSRTYGAKSTPHVYILNKTGADYIFSYIGAIDNNREDGNAATNKYVDNAMTEILAGKEVTTNSTKAIGCGIKWRKV
ncbi:MAG: thioredoxin family protein [Bacteroidota bacterium]|nr:thioredoxin family protein [Bacteroidota bacterium]